jgi:Ca-activated chloride channel homolog
LAAIILLILLFMRLLFWKKNTIRKIGDKILVMELIKNYSSRLFTLKFILLLLAFTAGIVAIANLRKPSASENITRKGIDVVIALDVSKSMLATDLQPSRLERAKQLIMKLIDRMPNDRIALVYFAGRAYLQMPLTVDHTSAKIFVNAASPDLVPTQGTIISEALLMGSRAFNTKEGRFKTIILISDGEDHDIDILNAVNQVADAGVMVNTVGIGSVEGAEIIEPSTGEPKKDANGNIVISKLNDAELKLVAEKTNGVYVHFDDSEQVVKTILDQLSQIEGKAFGDVSLMNYTTYYGWFAGLMLLLLVAEFFIPERKKLAA